jgi:hypothetical protein
MKLHDTCISHIAKIVQLAILTGTDIVDNMRAMEFNIQDDFLHLDEAYVESFEQNLSKMMDFIAKGSDTQENE